MAETDGGGAVGIRVSLGLNEADAGVELHGEVEILVAEERPVVLGGAQGRGVVRADEGDVRVFAVVEVENGGAVSGAFRIGCLQFDSGAVISGGGVGLLQWLLRSQAIGKEEIVEEENQDGKKVAHIISLIFVQTTRCHKRIFYTLNK